MCTFAFLSLELTNNHYRTGINITRVLHEVMPRCDQLLSACWWRNANRNCCEIFEVQKTEYGFCYSFNSELAQTAPADPTELRPRRSSGYGDWSGVKVTIHLGNITKPPNSGKDWQRQYVIFYVARRNDLYDLYEEMRYRAHSDEAKRCFADIHFTKKCNHMLNKIFWKFRTAMAEC